MVNVFSPFRLPIVADLDMVLQMGLKSMLKRKKTRRLNSGDSEPVKWTQGNKPSGVFTRGDLSSPDPQAKYLGLYLFANTSGCSRIASDCPSDTIHLNIVLHTGRWSLGDWMTLCTTPQISFHSPAMGETRGMTAV